MQKDGTNWILFGSKPKQKYLMRTFYDNSCFSSKFTSECIIFSSKYCMYQMMVQILFKSKPESVSLVIMNQNDVNFERKCPSLINKWPIWSIMDRPISLRKLTKVIILEFTKNFGHLGSFLVFFVQKFQKSEIFCWNNDEWNNHEPCFRPKTLIFEQNWHFEKPIFCAKIFWNRKDLESKKCFLSRIIFRGLFELPKWVLKHNRRILGAS